MTEWRTTIPTYAEHRVSVALQALGDNAEDVADLLRLGGWRGLPHSAIFCPIALYLRAAVTDVTDAAVGANQAAIQTTDGDHIEVQLTAAVAGFVLAFDIGAYPELVVTATDDNGDVIDDLEQ